MKKNIMIAAPPLLGILLTAVIYSCVTPSGQVSSTASPSSGTITANSSGGPQGGGPGGNGDQGGAPGGSTAPNQTDCSGTANKAAISTDTSIVNLAAQMKEFRGTLDSALLTKASYCLDSEQFYAWTNFPPGASQADRGGIKYGDMSATQLASFNKVLDTFLSTNGLNKVSLITNDVEGYLAKNDNPTIFGTDKYHVALFGNPETDGSWGFQLDGHHLTINALVHGDKVTIVPAFFGSQPDTINGKRVLGNERNNGFNLLNSLDATEKTKAIQTGSGGLQIGPGNSIDTNRNADYSKFNGIGLKASDMTAAQKALMRDLIKEYVYNMETKYADIWMKDIDAQIDNTYFVWIGSTNSTDGIYYRIYNPAVWIEFNNESGDLEHIHSIVRAPNGGDYGVFALKSGPNNLLEHYAMDPDHKNSKTKFDYSLASNTKVGFSLFRS